MNCRRLALLAVCSIILVHVGQGARATGPTEKHALATATILPSVKSGSDADGRQDNIASPQRGSVPIKKRFVDAQGYITTDVTTQRQIIYIIDLP